MTKLLDLASIREAKASLPVIDLLTLADTPPEREWLLKDFIPMHSATYLTGAGSSGKSLLGQQLCTAVASGLRFLGIEARACPALYVTCEDDVDELHRRQHAINRSLRTRYAGLDGKLHLVSLVGNEDNAIARVNGSGELRAEPLYEKLLNTALATGSRLVVLDNVAHLFGGNENHRAEVAAFVNLLNRLAVAIDGAVLFIGHPNKSGADFSGSTAWENQVRSRLFLEVPTDGNGGCIDRDARVLSRGKSNYAANGGELTFRWHEWAYVLPDDLPLDLRDEIAANVQANIENEAFLNCLEAATGNRRAVSHNPGVNYFGTVFPTMPEGRKLSRQAYERAFERLLHLGIIELDRQLWKRENRTWKYGIKLVDKCTDPPAPTPCTDLHRPPSQVIENTCTGLHAPTPLYTTYIDGAGHHAPPPRHDDEPAEGAEHG
ncbi:AAA family ATPase [Blastomonas sp. CCH5-A3]|jgi:hypothetical protein|uniref:AAA family ATPase n=1 Tax=Blastomonas sp. CCH5-A3 TaxID=1768761 RepID=UPI0008248A05|nr:AAA family ATPase [Blastomonas sp. CCH5-A3]MAF62787.1 hypothetical protein [Blastomonas sp.]|tara:strand:- start:63198 stop:64499 length:1302 start_codon:yes stop_codon:yes gene_type:complete